MPPSCPGREIWSWPPTSVAALDPRLQSPIPPFRDSYQTALFYSVLRAVDALEDVPEKQALQLSTGGMFSASVVPRLYEVGRHGAVDLSPHPGFASAALSSIHLPRSDVDPATGALQLPSLRTIGLLLCAAGLMVFCAILINSELWSLSHGRRLIGLLVLLALSGVLVVAFVAGARLDGTSGEPLTVTDGISVWPTASLRLLAFVLCVTFFAHSWWRLWESDRTLIRGFSTIASSCRALAPVPFVDRHPSLAAASPRSCGGTGALARVSSTRAWQERVRRVVPQVLVYGLFGLVLMLQSGFPVMPCRGDACFTLNYIILGCSVLAMTLLMFYVVDAPHACVAA